jgi:hypothetical protein
MSGCYAPEPNYNQILNSGMQTIVEAQRLRSVFPDAHDFISYFDGRYGNPAWNTKALLFRRYILVLQTPIKVDYSTNSIVEYGPVTIKLFEVVSSTPLSTGQKDVRYGQSWELTPRQLDTVIEAKGDFSSIGIELEDAKPVEGIDAIWWEI